MPEPVDHSLTYKINSFKNIVHKKRLAQILKLLGNKGTANYQSFIDIGCSNGYLTNLIAKKYNIKDVTGTDYDQQNLAIASKNYPHIKFRNIDLNTILPEMEDKYELLTCFETLEHVGHLEKAISNLLMIGEKSRILISVPIEIGFRGITKFFFKKVFYNYNLNELGKVKTWNYFFALLSGKNMTVFRDSKRLSWGTHFGFDYRVIDQTLKAKQINFKAFNYLTTRFYLIEPDQINNNK